MAERDAIVVGGGIGGLAVAIALHRRGWRLRLLERAPDFAEVGAGISLWPNALHALDLLGIGDRVRPLGGLEVSGGVRHRSGRWFSRIDAEEVTRRYGAVMILHRVDLLRALLEAVPPQALVPETEVVGVEERGQKVVVTHTEGAIEADLVVGADGLRSVVRRSIWPDAPAPRYAGYVAWRMITPPLREPLREGAETWGIGSRFGYAGLADGRVYCYATANAAEGSTFSRDQHAELRQRFGDWHNPIPQLLDAGRAEPVLRHDIYDLPDLASFASLRVALLGDAAHAMTPNLGQGACQALEDAATLGALLDGTRAVPDALARYDQLRRARTQAIVKQSRRVGAVGQWSWGPAVAMRDLLLPLVPSSVAIRSLGSVLRWNPGSEIRVLSFTVQRGPWGGSRSHARQAPPTPMGLAHERRPTHR